MNAAGDRDHWVRSAQKRGEGATSRYTFEKWWSVVEAGAHLPPVPRRQWHSLRGKFATETKPAPLEDLAYLGGWKSVATVVEAYQCPATICMTSRMEPL